MNKQRTFMQHWPVLLLGMIVVVIFSMILIVFTVKETECALVLRLGGVKTDAAGKVIVCKPGLGFKLPYPIEEVWRHDARLHHFRPSKAQIEQASTRDGYQVLLSTYVGWQIDENKAEKFMIAYNTTERAENELLKIVRSARSIVIAKYNLDEIINVDAKRLKVDQIENDIRNLVQEQTEQYGMIIKRVGITHIGFPDAVKEKVIERMQTDRRTFAAKTEERGKTEASNIRSKAEEVATGIRSEAIAEATRIRGEGDAAAAKAYSEFAKNPELAVYLRKLESLKKSFGPNTTLFLDNTMPPFDLLKADSTRLLTLPAPAGTNAAPASANQE